MEPYKLVHTGDFVKRAKDFGLEIRLDISRTSGFQVGWMYVGETEQMKQCRATFRSEGLPAHHLFRKVNKL
jgi:hypothetical protein